MKSGLLTRLMRRFSAPRVGLALSGGGARGLAHIGVLKVLEQENIPIHFIAGASAGGLVGAAYAAGLSASDLEREALWLSNPRHLITLLDRGRGRRGLLAGQKVIEYLAERIGDVTFDQLHIPLAVMAADIAGGKKVVLNEGSVLEAVRATIALPGIFAPVDRNGPLLVDGGLLDNLPTDTVREMGADVVIAVDVATDENAIASFTEGLQRRRLIPSGLVGLVDVLWRSVAVMMREVNRHNLEQAQPDLLIRPSIPPGVTVFTGITRAPEVIAAGEQAAIEALPRLEKLIG